MSNSSFRERYSPLPITADGDVKITSSGIGGFLCTTAGTLSLSSNKIDGKPATVLFTDFAVTAGTYYPMPFFLGASGGVLTVTGARGVLGV